MIAELEVRPELSFHSSGCLLSDAIYTWLSLLFLLRLCLSAFLYTTRSSQLATYRIVAQSFNSRYQQPFPAALLFFFSQRLVYRMLYITHPTFFTSLIYLFFFGLIGQLL
jgi:hypothetical protein